jgi:hypothetical protein
MSSCRSQGSKNSIAIPREVVLSFQAIPPSGCLSSIRAHLRWSNHQVVSVQMQFRAPVIAGQGRNDHLEFG